MWTQVNGNCEMFLVIPELVSRVRCRLMSDRFSGLFADDVVAPSKTFMTLVKRQRKKKISHMFGHWHSLYIYRVFSLQTHELTECREGWRNTWQTELYRSVSVHGVHIYQFITVELCRPHISWFERVENKPIGRHDSCFGLCCLRNIFNEMCWTHAHRTH